MFSRITEWYGIPLVGVTVGCVLVWTAWVAIRERRGRHSRRREDRQRERQRREYWGWE